MFVTTLVEHGCDFARVKASGGFPQGSHRIVDFCRIGVAAAQFEPDDDRLRWLAESLQFVGRADIATGIIWPLTPAAQAAPPKGADPVRKTLHKLRQRFTETRVAGGAHIILDRRLSPDITFADDRDSTARARAIRQYVNTHEPQYGFAIRTPPFHQAQVRGARAPRRRSGSGRPLHDQRRRLAWPASHSGFEALRNAGRRVSGKHAFSRANLLRGVGAPDACTIVTFGRCLVHGAISETATNGEQRRLTPDCPGISCGAGGCWAEVVRRQTCFWKW